MPKLHKNEKYTRDITNRISNMTGLPYNAVRSVIDGVELCILDDLRNLSLQGNIDDKLVLQVEIPNIGTLKLSTTTYPKEMSLPNYTDGRSFRSKIELTEKFLSRARWAYYNRYDHLTQRAEANFSSLFNNHYQSIINEEDGEK